MKTIQAIKLLLEEYKQHVERIVARTKEDYDKQVKDAQAETLDKLKKLRQIFPDIMQIDDGSMMNATEIETIISNLKHRAEMKYSAPLLPSGVMLLDEIYGAKFYTPAFVEWQGATSKEANFVISYNKSTVKEAISSMNFLVGSMLLSLPIKQVHLNFVDLNYTGAAQLFTINLDKSLYRDLIVDTQQLNIFCKEMQQRMVTVLQECGNLVDYNVENQTYRYPYEVVVLLDYPNMYDYAAQQLTALFENGHKGGIYFVVLHNTDIKLPNHNKSLVDMTDHYSILDFEKMKVSQKGVMKPMSLLENKSLSKSIFRYINEEAQRKPAEKQLKADYRAMYDKPYQEVDKSTLVVPVGEDEKGNTSYFVTNIIDHVSSFVMGTVGSGKSSFLKSIIADAMLTYSPQDLQFYLLDFKGVELNMFKESKHVRTLLTNGNDLDMTLEVFRDLYKEYERRNHELFGPIQCSDIISYNRKCPKDKRLPQILLVADECQLLFNSTNSQYSRKYRELSSLIVDIARLGRSTGIHLIFATQTLVGTDFPNEVINVIHDKYLLKCVSNDSEKMIEGSSKYTENLPPGKVFSRIDQEDKMFQSYFFSDEDRYMIMKYVLDKAKDFSGQPVLINGSQIFELTDEIISSLPSRRNNVAALGCSLDLNHTPVKITFKDQEYSENILFFGINDQEQVTRTVMNALMTLVYTAYSNGRTLHTYVIDSFGMEDGKYKKVLDRLQSEGLVTVIKKRDASIALYRIAAGIINGTIEPSLLVVLGQERLLKSDKPIEIDEVPSINNAATNDDWFKGLKDFDQIGSDEDNIKSKLLKDDFGKGQKGDTDGIEKSKKPDISSYCKALEYILDNGHMKGVNTLLQIDVPSKLLCNKFVNKEFITNKFNHLVMLRSDKRAVSVLNLDDDIHIEQLPSDAERLRAIYYDTYSEKYQVFTPYIIK